MAARSSMVPPVAVYLLKSSRMARMAASFTFSGVGKSGSPAPKSIRSAPSERSFSASIITAMVEETEMRETLLEKAISAVLGLNCTLLMRLHLLGAEPLLHQRRNQAADVPTQLTDLPHQARAEEGVGHGWHHEDGLQIGVQLAIHQSHLHFVLKI